MANGTLPAGTFPSEYGQTTDSDGVGNVTTTIHAVDSNFTQDTLDISIQFGYNNTLDSASTGGLLLRSTIRPSDSDFTISGIQTAVASTTLDSASTGGLLLRSTLRPIESDFSIFGSDLSLTSTTLISQTKTALLTNLQTRSPITGFAKNIGDMKLGDQSVEFKITI